MKRPLTLVGVIIMVACGGSGPDTATSPSPLSAAFGESLSLKVETAHFRVFGGATPDAALRAAADRLEAEYDVTTDSPIYQIGYLLGEFIVSRYGRGPFLRLIETGADLQGALGISSREFEAAWQSYVRQRYLS